MERISLIPRQTRRGCCGRLSAPRTRKVTKTDWHYNTDCVTTSCHWGTDIPAERRQTVVPAGGEDKNTLCAIRCSMYGDRGGKFCFNTENVTHFQTKAKFTIYKRKQWVCIRGRRCHSLRENHENTHETPLTHIQAYYLFGTVGFSL